MNGKPSAHVNKKKRLHQKGDKIRLTKSHNRPGISSHWHGGLTMALSLISIVPSTRHQDLDDKAVERDELLRRDKGKLDLSCKQ